MVGEMYLGGRGGFLRWRVTGTVGVSGEGGGLFGVGVDGFFFGWF